MRLFLILLIFISTACLAQESDSAVAETPFRKGRWITGLNGRISSGTTEFDSLKIRSNSYAISIGTGRIFKDRWLAGLLLEAGRENAEDFNSRESEFLFVGPAVTRYFSKSAQGSVYLLLSPGYARTRESNEFEINGIVDEQEVIGSGFGLVSTLGYSYVMNDQIGFNIGLTLTNFWIDATRTSALSNVRTSESLKVGELSFTFGFSVILDDFFF